MSSDEEFWGALDRKPALPPLNLSTKTISSYHQENAKLARGEKLKQQQVLMRHQIRKEMKQEVEQIRQQFQQEVERVAEQYHELMMTVAHKDKEIQRLARHAANQEILITKLRLELTETPPVVYRNVEPEEPTALLLQLESMRELCAIYQNQGLDSLEQCRRLQQQITSVHNDARLAVQAEIEELQARCKAAEA